MHVADFEAKKGSFRRFYDDNRLDLERAKDLMIELLGAITRARPEIGISKIEGRVKDREECLKKFVRKYRTAREDSGEDYEIKDEITDLIGLRVVCLYEDHIVPLRDVFEENFHIIGITDKITEIEGTEASFGYKGLHVDLSLKPKMLKHPVYAPLKGLSFEVQIRTVVQDSWSIIDHKIKYKKSVGNDLKRRINTLAALFELADHEFKAIRDATASEQEKSERSYGEIERESKELENNDAPPRFTTHYLDAFSFNRIATHFFDNYDFEPHKVDGFVEEIVSMKSDITRGKLNYYLRDFLPIIKKYKEYLESENRRINPFTVIRHCLFIADRDTFAPMLTADARDAFNEWYRGQIDNPPNIEGK